MNWKILLLIIVALILYTEWRGPWEERARKNFNEHFTAFEKLEQMQRKDIGTYFIGQPGLPSPSKGLTKERWGEYLKLLDEASLIAMLYVKVEPKKRMIRFMDDEDANDYGYVYMEYPPPKFFNSFKECVPIMPTESCYVLLRKNWYLFSERARLEQTDAK
jgi:hypothetical protein